MARDCRNTGQPPHLCRRGRGFAASGVFCLILIACETYAGGAGGGWTSSFEDAFRVVSRVELEEREDDVIADIGVFREARDGDFLISDRLKPRLRRYGPAGLLIADFGSYGEGPFEFRRMGGVVEDPSGSVIVVDPILSRVAILGPSLDPDTMFRLAVQPRGGMEPIGGGLLLNAASGSRASALVFLSTAESAAIWSVPAPSPGSMVEYPYWGSIASIPFATSPTEFVVAYSLLYPIRIYSGTGELVDSLPRPRSFRQATKVDAGSFAGPGSRERLQRWLASFDVIAGLAVVDDSLLVVTHGKLSSTPGSRFSESHVRLDVYHLPSRSKIAEDVPLPPEARVLGGGRGLYILTALPPDPWTITRVQPIQ